MKGKKRKRKESNICFEVWLRVAKRKFRILKYPNPVHTGLFHWTYPCRWCLNPDIIPAFSWRGWERNHKNLSKYSLCLGRDSNRAPREYNTR
jgi:hypothetical protein